MITSAVSRIVTVPIESSIFEQCELSKNMLRIK